MSLISASPAFTVPSFLNDCPIQSVALDVDKGFSMDYIFYEDNDEQLFLKARMSYEGQAWLGFGYSPSGLMVPGHLIVGLPESGIDNDVQEYAASSYEPNGSGVVPKTEQSLQDVKLIQSDDTTVMEFTTPLDLENNVFLDTEGVFGNVGEHVFLWAYGFSNRFVFHEGYGWQSFDVSTACEPLVVNTPSAVPSASLFVVETAAPVDPLTLVPEAPSAPPSDVSSAVPSTNPSATPTAKPSANPSVTSAVPSIATSASPSVNSTSAPPPDVSSAVPSTKVSATPTAIPSAIPSANPTENPTANPTANPSATPTASPSATSAAPSIATSSLPTANPSSTSSVLSDGVEANTTDTPSQAPSLLVSSVPSETVNCSEYQYTIELDPSLVINYVVVQEHEELYFRAQLVLTSQAWVGFGVSTSDQLMLNSNMIMGLPDDGNVVKYTAINYDPTGSGIIQLSDEKQTLMDVLIEQNRTSGTTVMEFQKKLVEPKEIPITLNGTNYFMYAYGFGNDFGFHRAYGTFTVDLGLCNDGSDDFQLVESGNRYTEFYAAHGILAAIAWGVLTPLAIGSSILRKWITYGKDSGLWFKLHFYLNLLALVMNIASFVLAVSAHQLTTPPGEDPKHFTAFAHATIGLIIMILLLVQVIGGIMRPSTEKANVRFVWLAIHRVFGIILVGLSWYQVLNGLNLFATLFNATNYGNIFGYVVGTITMIILLTFLFGSPKDPSASANSNKIKADDVDVNRKTKLFAEIDFDQEEYHEA